MNYEIYVDGRTGEEILKQARKIAPHYIPDWDFSDENDSGVVLLKIFSKLMEDVVKRLDEVPEKHFTAFLDVLGMGLNPSQPARVPLTFAVSEGATESVMVPELTQVTAAATETRPELTFEVEPEKGFLATPSTLKKIYSVNPKTDGIFEHKQTMDQGKSTELFKDDNLQEHILYIGHGDLLNITGQAKIELMLKSRGLIDLSSVVWEYYGEKIEIKDAEEIITEGWHPLTLINGEVERIPPKISGKTPVIDIRGINRVFADRLKKYGINTLDALSKLAADDLAKKLSTSKGRAENILEAVEKGLLDKSAKQPEIEIPAKPGKGQITLLKKQIGEIKEFEVNGVKSRWIRCRSQKSAAKLSESLIYSMTIRVGPYEEEGELPDMAYYNEVPLDLKGISDQEPIYPFGEIPSIYNSFYIASSDAFSKKWADISLTFDIQITNMTATSAIKPRLSWEYWNGQGWTIIEDLVDNTKNLTAAGKKTVTFTCPGDLEKTDVNGQENYWIRIRLVDGDYGKIKFKEISEGTWESSDENIKAPSFKDISIYYKEHGEKPGRIPGHIITYNNLDYDEVLAEKGIFERFKFFEMMDDDSQSVYFGFDKQLISGPINIFFSITEREYPETFYPKFVWEYYSGADKNIWTKLDIIDETENLTKRGILSLVAPDDLSSSKRFGENLYWIRARLTSEEFDLDYKKYDKEDIALKYPSHQSHLEPCEEVITIDTPIEQPARYPPLLKDVKINTTWAYQAETLKDEILGSSDGTPDQQFVFSKLPVFNEEIWVNELSSLSVGEREDMLENSPSSVHEIKDDEGNTAEFWVQWESVDDFLISGTEDRHYVLEPTMGTVSFGNGINGKVPPIDSDNIKASYKTGGGSAGNVEGGVISSLKSSISFIDSVTNPEPADGGADTEIMDELKIRAPQQLKNRGRAVTAGDYEYIALESSRKVARVQCIPNLDNRYKISPGWVTVIVVPESSEDKPELSVGLKEIVSTYLNNNCAGMLATQDRLTVNGPCYLGISISARLVAKSADKIRSIESEAYNVVKTFLHPLTGGYLGKGWEFGKMPCLSDFYRILEEIEDVDHVENLSMEISGTGKDQKVVITPQSAFYPQLKPYNLVFSGDHRIDVTI